MILIGNERKSRYYTIVSPGAEMSSLNELLPLLEFSISGSISLSSLSADLTATSF